MSDESPPIEGAAPEGAAPPAPPVAPAPPAPEPPHPENQGRVARCVAEARARGRHPELAAILAFLVPGLGHLYLGKTVKGVFALVFLCGLFGWGVKVSAGECVSLDKQNGHPYAFFAQLPAGLPTGLALLHTHQYEVKQKLGIEADRPTEPDYEKDLEAMAQLPHQDEGLLYTMIAGLLNLLLIHDALLGSPGSALREPRRTGGAPPTPPKEALT
jgi:hypothetical protein